MGLFKKKCASCGAKIDKGKEYFRGVKDPVFTDKKKKTFCCENCADNYENKSASCCRKGGGCCG